MYAKILTAAGFLAGLSLTSFYLIRKAENLAEKREQKLEEESQKILNKYKIREERENYEKELIQQFGEFSAKNINCSIIVVSNLQNRELFSEEEKALLTSRYDFCVLLGNNSKKSVKALLKFIPHDKLCGILGEDDESDTLEYFKIPNIEKTPLKFANVIISGMGYVSNETEDDSLKRANTIAPSDIFFSYEPAWKLTSELGNKGISYFIIKNQIRTHYYGKISSFAVNKLKNGCTSIGFEGIQKIKYEGISFSIDNLTNTNKSL